MKTIIQAGCLLVTAAVTMSICSCSKKKTTETSDAVQSVEVTTPIVDSIVLYKSYPGYAYANIKASVVGRVNGTLLSKEFSGGQLVKKGQVLYRIEPTSYADAVNQAQATLATAESNYQYASNQYQAMKKALESDAVAQIEVIKAKSDMETAEASIKNAKAALNTANQNLGYCTVVSPITGHIDDGTTDIGNYISGESSPYTLATVVDDTDMSILFAIEENQYEKLMGDINSAIGHKLYDSIPLEFTEPLPHAYHGRLVYESPIVDKSTGTLKLKVKTANPYGDIRDGMYASVRLPYGESSKAILVKDASIGTDQLGKYLYVVNDSNKVVYTTIEVGDLYHDSLRVVTKGITPESRYVTSALLKVRDGMTIKPIEVK